MAKSRDDFTIAWITDEMGKLVAEKVLGKTLQRAPRDFARSDIDLNSYSWGQIDSQNVVIVVPPSNVSAGVTVKTLMAAVPNVRFGLFVGTAAAHPEPTKRLDIRLGDIVVNQPGEADGGLVQYDPEAAKGQQRINQERFLETPPNILTDSLQPLIHDWALTAKRITLDSTARYRPPTGRAGKDRLFSPLYKHLEGTNCLSCDRKNLIRRRRRPFNGSFFYSGLIASSSYVVRDVEARRMIENYVGEECLCFDTTTAGLMRNFPCLIVRGVSRYADSHKNNLKWNYHASGVAAAFTRLYIQTLSVSEVNGMVKAATICGIPPIDPWMPERCRLCLNLECSPGTTRLDIAIPASSLFDNLEECPLQYCTILKDLWALLLKEWNDHTRYEEIDNFARQSELRIELQRGRSQKLEDLPKEEGSEINEEYDNEISDTDIIELLDLSFPISVQLTDVDFDADYNDLETAPCLCMLQVLSDPTGRVMPDILRKSIQGYAIGSTESTDFVQHCIDDCRRGSGTRHPNCHQLADSPLPTRVLDIRNGQVRLRESSGTFGKYCTLSYRWGLPKPKDNYKTTRSNLDRFQKLVPWDELPPLIRDAITVTRQLDVAYLWVDALCIIQGDETDWALECPRMGSYYQNAYVTICPSYAEDVWSHFIQPKRPIKTEPLADILEERTRSHVGETYNQRIEYEERLKKLLMEPTAFSIPFQTHKGTEITLHARTPYTSQHSSIIAASPLAERGWTWQENILSQRIAHFTPWEVVFECRSGQTFEYTSHVNLNSGLSEYVTRFTSNPETIWKQYVCNFSDKALTRESDRLPAISGIVDLISPNLNGPYLAGLWADWLDTDLLWYVDNFSGVDYYSIRPRVRPLASNPSWSWASLIAKVKFPVQKSRGERKLQLLRHSCQPASENPYGPLKADSTLEVLGSVAHAQISAEIYSPYECALRFIQPELRESVVDLRLRHDCELQTRIIDGVYPFQTVDRDYKTLSAPGGKGDDSDTESKPGFHDVHNAFLTLEERKNEGTLSFIDYIQAGQVIGSREFLALMPEMKEMGIVPSDYPHQPGQTRAEGNVLCLLLAEHVAKNYPEPFTYQEKVSLMVSLGYKDPELMTKSGSERWDGRPIFGVGQPAVNQWYLVLGCDPYKEKTPHCWRVGVLDLWLAKKVKLQRRLIKIR